MLYSKYTTALTSQDLCQHTIVALLAASAGKLDGFFRNDESLNESLPQIQKLITEAISGMVASLDPHSAYLDKKAYAELREGSQGKFVGLGIEIGQSEDGYIKIVAPIEDSPAYRAGIKAGDLIDLLATELDLHADEGMPNVRFSWKTIALWTGAGLLALVALGAIVRLRQQTRRA